MVGTIEINGTGGILEGNLGAANVDVNIDKALYFAGTNDFINLDTAVSAVSGLTQGTISAWFKTPVSTQTGNIFGASDSGDPSSEIRVIVETNKIHFSVREDETFIVRVSTDATINDNSWHHVAVTNTTSGNKIYLDGVEQAVTYVAGNASTDAFFDNVLNIDAVRIGSNVDSGGDYQWNFLGNIADVRVYNTALTTEIPILASRIGIDNSIVQSADTRVGYWLLNAETASGGGAGTGYVQGSHQGTLNNFPTSPAYWDFDAFSVNVQDTMTTTGTTTVTQGKLEGLSLSSLDFTGSSQYVTCNSNNFFHAKTAFTTAAWVRHDNSQDGALGSIVCHRDNGNDGFALSYTYQ